MPNAQGILMRSKCKIGLAITINIKLKHTLYMLYVCWHAVTNEFLLWSDLTSLSGVYDELCEDKMKKMTLSMSNSSGEICHGNNFDIDPYFICESGLDTRFTACFVEWLRVLECVGFRPR